MTESITYKHKDESEPRMWNILRSKFSVCLQSKSEPFRQILFTPEDFAIIEGTRKKKKGEPYELMYSGKRIVIGTYGLCQTKKKQLILAGHHYEGNFEIK